MATIQVEVTRYSDDPGSEYIRVYGLVSVQGGGAEPYQSTVNRARWLPADDAGRARLAADALYSAYQAFNAQTVTGWRRTFTYQNGGPGGQ